MKKPEEIEKDVFKAVHSLLRIAYGKDIQFVLGIIKLKEPIESSQVTGMANVPEGRLKLALDLIKYSLLEGEVIEKR